MQKRAIGFNSMRQAQTTLAVGFIALNFLLFLPFYLVFSYENNFTPFFPLGHPRGAYDWQWLGLVRSIYEYVMQLFVRRHNLDIFRLSAEWVLLCSTLVLVSRLIPRWRRCVTTLAGLGYAFLLSFLMYSAFIHNCAHTQRSSSMMYNSSTVVGSSSETPGPRPHRSISVASFRNRHLRRFAHRLPEPAVALAWRNITDSLTRDPVVSFESLLRLVTRVVWNQP